MKATLTALRRKTAKILKPVLGGHSVVITNHGTAVAKIVPQKAGHKGLIDLLRSIGPVELPPRK